MTFSFKPDTMFWSLGVMEFGIKGLTVQCHCVDVVFLCSGLDEGLPCSYFHETAGLTEAQRIERFVVELLNVIDVG